MNMKYIHKAYYGGAKTLYIYFKWPMRSAIRYEETMGMVNSIIHCTLNMNTNVDLRVRAISIKLMILVSTKLTYI